MTVQKYLYGVKMVKIGLIGHGFVGSAVAQGMSQGVGFNSTIRIYDKDPSRSIDSLYDVVNKSDFIFVSVPTPSKTNGEIDLRILDNCLSSISKTMKESRKSKAILLIRSTIVPGSTRKFSKKYKDLRIVFNPEFLTERSALFDFISQSRFILGGSKKDTKTVANLFRKRFGPSLSIIETSYETAELIKYMNNTFFATKVSFLNEMYLLSKSVKADWASAVEGFIRDGRVGHSHTQVPGHDGRFGFGGSCFPKDVQALIKFGESKNVDLNVIKDAGKLILKLDLKKTGKNLLAELYLKRTVMKSSIYNKNIFLTGGTGSFGKCFIKQALKEKVKQITVFSRDEMKQWNLDLELNEQKRVNFVIGDVRDLSAIKNSIGDSELIVHAAATKIVPTAEYNPAECVKTNVLGALNIIEAARNTKVKKVVALSTDKASAPINLYGATKLVHLINFLLLLI